MDHRGRFQAQGGGIEESEPWQQASPLVDVVARDLLARLERKIPAREAEIRRQAFRKARDFIDKCAAAGGIGPIKQSWPKPARSDSRRVDIEVNSGIAFVRAELVH